MFITGYHGTTEKCAKEILDSNNFTISTGKKEWIGNGIYFYPDINDAYNWRNNEAILHTIIRVHNDEYLDIDSEEGHLLYNNIIKDNSSRCDFNTPSNQENQCAVMNLIWNLCEEIKVISASFATEKTKVKTLIDTRPRRKEFCVRNNDCIVLIQKIRRSDLDGQYR